MTKFAILLLPLLLLACNRQPARYSAPVVSAADRPYVSILQAANYRKIITGKAADCDLAETGRKFAATSKSGQRVIGKVCILEKVGQTISSHIKIN